MRVISNMIDEASFCRAVRFDPDLVFVEGYRAGRPIALSVSTALEELATSSSLIVQGPSWRVHVSRGFRGAVTTPIRLRPNAKLGKRTFSGQNA